MEKIIYALWAKDGEDRPALNVRLRGEVADALLAREEVRGLRLNLQDETTTRADGLRMACPGAQPPDAAVQIWLDVRHAPFRRPVDELLTAAAGRIAAWGVLSSTIIPNRDHPPRPGERTWGWSQLCFLKRPDRLDPASWRHNWQALHTQVAIDTQANFEYVQNLIVETLIAGPQDYAAIVEECFPAEAMDDPQAFFDAPGDEARFAANSAALMESCARFIDEGCVDLLPTSQYHLR